MCSKHHFMTMVKTTTPVRPTPALQWITTGVFFPLPSSLSASRDTESTSSKNPINVHNFTVEWDVYFKVWDVFVYYLLWCKKPNHKMVQMVIPPLKGSALTYPCTYVCTSIPECTYTKALQWRLKPKITTNWTDAITY